MKTEQEIKALFDTIAKMAEANGRTTLIKDMLKELQKDKYPEEDRIIILTFMEAFT